MTRNEILKLLKENLSSEIDIADKDHGWADSVIRVRLKNSDLLINVVPGGISISCMCFLSSPETSYGKVVSSSKVLDEINGLKEHSCVPWPG